MTQNVGGRDIMRKKKLSLEAANTAHYLIDVINAIAGGGAAQKRTEVYTREGLRTNFII